MLAHWKIEIARLELPEASLELTIVEDEGCSPIVLVPELEGVVDPSLGELEGTDAVELISLFVGPDVDDMTEELPVELYTEVELPVEPTLLSDRCVVKLVSAVEDPEYVDKDDVVAAEVVADMTSLDKFPEVWYKLLLKEETLAEAFTDSVGVVKVLDSVGLVPLDEFPPVRFELLLPEATRCDDILDELKDGFGGFEVPIIKEDVL
ncbi:uncharacterized protein N0V89_010459 [Didymosphaeria variabile]|uniref:Uncharacterized protein n=1 Tax=Didymosphaeria variabile TaxID=1932322 RepID=A0A9W8XBT7_9PLEO|nr:uncharacterized protein N0V89_010459 [Didymosphaeria variabile]KAJ4346528.1 hypothetical protein N0V89_010459 [Didymosphaeria variabile]